jgi:hypothetical protein
MKEQSGQKKKEAKTKRRRKRSNSTSPDLTGTKRVTIILFWKRALIRHTVLFLQTIK